MDDDRPCFSTKEKLNYHYERFHELEGGGVTDSVTPSFFLQWT